MRVARFLTPLLFAAALFAQHTYTLADIENGGRLYLANCTVCHGPDGDLQPGVNLGRGKFRRASSDDELEQIITKGIPGTGMPSHDLTPQQVESVVAYLRSMAASGHSTLPSGNAARGKAIFEGKGECLNCHRVHGSGSYSGPDLSDIGLVRRTAELEKSLVDPNAEILPDNRVVHVVTKDGKEMTARLLNADTLALLVLDAQGQLHSYSKSDLREYSLMKDSSMPSYKGKLTTQEMGDVVSYMASLKGAETR
ncbi:MAG: c-type cytochrome [Acidobacteriia bacterium]|nr:c-type cytochrome [Terriglobia bacterium]